MFQKEEETAVEKMEPHGRWYEEQMADHGANQAVVCEADGND